MKFRIAKDELTRALSRVQGIVEKRSTKPVIGNVLLTADADGLVVSATDTEVSFVGRYAAECSEPGSITLGARQLYSIARLLPTQKVEFALDPQSQQANIVSGRASFNLMGLAASEFPEVPDLSEVDGFTLSSAALKRLIDHTLFAISSDDTRVGLNGAHVESADGVEGTSMLRFVATDGHRLSLCTAPHGGTYTAPGSVLLPKKGLAELRKLCDNDTDDWTVSILDNQCLFKRGSVGFAMRLLEGQFPPYQQVVPSSWQRRVLVDRQALVQALKRVSILADDKTSPVKLEIAGGQLIVTARQAEMGDAREEIEAEVEGEDLVVGFNARYFLDALAVLGDDTVVVEIGDSLSPCLLKPLNEDLDELFVVMPMRLE